MSNAEAALSKVLELDGAIAIAVVDYSSGLALVQKQAAPFDLELAAAANTEVIRAKLRAIEQLGLEDGIEDILITLGRQYHLIRQPDILIIEGLNVLQTGPRLMVSDLFDFSIYVAARIEDIEAWYIQRFLALRNTSFADPSAHFHHYSGLSDRDATIAAKEIWNSINHPNLVENILPTRPRATLVLRKDADHTINRLRLRKL